MSYGFTADHLASARAQPQALGVPSAVVMLVRVERTAESHCLGLGDLPAAVVRVRHPLPAVARMRTLRPAVVVVGPGVTDVDLEVLTEAGRECGSRIIEMDAFVAPAALRESVSRAIERVSARGTPSEDDLPVAARSPANRTPPPGRSAT